MLFVFGVTVNSSRCLNHSASPVPMVKGEQELNEPFAILWVLVATHVTVVTR